jgi:predicted methyltransferase
MIRFATSTLSCAIAGLVMSAAFAQTPAGHDMASMPGMAGMHDMHGEIPVAIAKAVNDPGRAEDAKVDARRHGAELVAFAGVKPGDKVLELVPGSGYFTRIFSKVVGPKGSVSVAVPAEIEKKYPDVDKMRALAKDYPNVDVLLQPAAALRVTAPVDVVFTSQNYHDYATPLMGPTDPAVLDKAVFAALKPGGTFVVIDHVAEAGSGLRDNDTLHRIDPAFVKKQVEAAGFEYVGESDVLRNPNDDHKKIVFDDSIRGHTDQFVYKFRKPAAAH